MASRMPLSVSLVPLMLIDVAAVLPGVKVVVVPLVVVVPNWIWMVALPSCWPVLSVMPFETSVCDCASCDTLTA